jgi:hypothetical protein
MTNPFIVLLGRSVQVTQRVDSIGVVLDGLVVVDGVRRHTTIQLAVWILNSTTGGGGPGLALDVETLLARST